jgi:branched-chain amino acid transport system ATP-binding protein
MSQAPVIQRRPEPALAVDDLVGGYDATVVLRKVSLSVAASSVVALLGPNGAGKSTLLKMVCGLLRPDSGTITMAGQDVTPLSSHRRADLGLCYIPEGRGIFRSLTVKENLILQAEPGRKARDSALALACEAFPVLGRKLPQTAGTLSGGEQQMLAVAQAYVRQPTLILVDEASFGLAPKMVNTIFEFLQRATELGAALLLVDQFVERALELADHVYVLNGGEIVFSGAPQGLDQEQIMQQYLGTSPTTSQ